jgi:parallel beta-helix repeat protein
MLAVVFYAQPVKAQSGTIYVRADGSIDQPTAPIYTADNVTYTLTGNIIVDADGIMIERDNIVLNGRGYTVTGSGSGNGTTLTSRSNLTVNNTNMKNFTCGIYLYSSSNNTLSDNNIANNYDGIGLDSNSGNTLSGNNITANTNYGILFNSSSNNVLSGNNIANSEYGIELSSSNNIIFHNNFVDNTNQVFFTEGSANFWDDGYPSGGNYWSDYTSFDVKSGSYQNETGSEE